MKRTAIASIILGLALIFLTTIAVNSACAQLPPVTNGSCSVSKITYQTSSDVVTTPITSTFTNLADMHDLGFTVAEGQCVKIEVSFNIVHPVWFPIELRAMLDDGPNTVPSTIVILPGLSFGYQTFTFLVPAETGLGPGGHHIDIEVRGHGVGNIVTEKRMLTLLHN